MALNTENKKIAKETFWGFATKFTVLPFFLLLNILLTRMLGPEKWGEWTYFFSFFNVFYLLALFGVRSSQKYAAQHNLSDQLPHVLADSMKMRFVLSIVFGAIVFASGFIIPELIDRPSFRTLFWISSILIFISGFTEYFKGIFTGVHRVKYNFLVSTTEFSLKLLLAGGFLYWGLQLEGVLWAFIIAVTVAGFLGLLLQRKISGGPKGEKEQNYFKEIFNYSLPLFVISLGFSVATEVDTIMLGLLSNDLEVGDYGIAKQLISKLPHISYALAMGTMPLFARLSAGNLEERRILFKRVLKLNALIFVPGIVALCLLAPMLIPLVYGADYIGAVLPIQILSGYLLIATTSVFFNQLLDYQHRAKKRAINLLFSLLLNIALNYWLIPLYGAIGAAISTSVSYLPYLVLNVLEVQQVFRSYESSDRKES